MKKRYLVMGVALLLFGAQGCRLAHQLAVVAAVTAAANVVIAPVPMYGAYYGPAYGPMGWSGYYGPPVYYQVPVQGVPPGYFPYGHGGHMYRRPYYGWK